MYSEHCTTPAYLVTMVQHTLSWVHQQQFYAGIEDNNAHVLMCVMCRLLGILAQLNE